MEEQNIQKPDESMVQNSSGAVNHMPDDQNLQKEVKSKAWVGILIFVIIILLVVGGAYYYFFYYQNTNKYLEKISNNVTTLLNNETKDLEAIKGKDVVVKGGIELPNIANANLEIGLNQKTNGYVNLNYNINGQGAEKQSIYFQNGKLYAEDEQGLVEIGDINLTQEGITNINDLMNAEEKVIEYMFTALKEAKTSTELKGITEKEYVLIIDESNVDAVNAKFKELVTNDEKVSKLMTTDDLDVFTEMEVRVTVNPLNDEVKGFTLENAEATITGKEDGEKFVITGTDGSPLDVYVRDDAIKVTTVYDDAKVVLNYNKNKDMDLIITKDENTFSITYKNEESLKINMANESMDVRLEANINKKSDNNTTIDGVVRANVGVENFSVNFNLDVQYGENLVKDIDTSKARKEGNTPTYDSEDLGNIFDQVL